MSLHRAPRNFWALKMSQLMRLVFEKPQNLERWEAVKDLLNVVAQRAVRSDHATATKTTLNAIANAIQKYQLAITKLNDLFAKFLLDPVSDF